MDLSEYNSVRVRSVFDGTTLCIPGKPRRDQCIGTTLENLAEIAGRTCYDSLGTGRDSRAFHRHILDVGHLNVYEHCVFSFSIDFRVSPVLLSGLFALAQRPGVWMERSWAENGTTVNICMNVRAAV